MARHEGGIFSRPRGKTGGLVFGAARTREGKQVTSRLLVVPSNPNTSAQQDQRGIFNQALELVRSIGAAIYQDDFNRAVAQLPGFQALMSILMNQMAATGVMTAPPDTNLGTLSLPAGLAVTTGGDQSTIDVSWTGAGPSPQHANDTCVALALENFASVAPDKRLCIPDIGELRSTNGFSISGLTAGASYLVAVYFRGAVGQTTEGLLSRVRWTVVTAHV